MPSPKVKVIKMNDAGGGFGWQAKQLNDKIFTVRYVDSTKQIHLEGTGIALIPGVDQYEVVKENGDLGP